MKHRNVTSRTPRNECPGYHAPDAPKRASGGGYPHKQPFNIRKKEK